MINATTALKAESRNLNFFYADGKQALKSVNMPLYENKITALIGPSEIGRAHV
jgi:phosphate transport system ATP-binding protein